MQGLVLPIIILAGPDGTGKSTVRELIETSGDVVRREHYRPRPPVENGAVSDPHSLEAYDKPRAILKLMFLFGEQILSVPTRLMASRRGWVVIERGWWDAAVDLRRYRIPPGLRWAVALLGLVLPKADMIVLLHADPKAIHARKPELSAEEAQRQIDAWRDVAPRAAKRVRCLKTENLESTSEDLEQILRGLE
jgi:hypothetical protein